MGDFKLFTFSICLGLLTLSFGSETYLGSAAFRYGREFTISAWIGLATFGLLGDFAGSNFF